MTTNQNEIALDDYIKKNKQFKGKTIRDKIKPSKTIKVDNLHLEITDTELYKIFAEKGSLIKCKIVQDKFNRSLGKAILSYEQLSDAKNAVEDLDGLEVKGQKIKVKYAQPLANKPVQNNRNQKIRKTNDRGHINRPRTGSFNNQRPNSFNRNNRNRGTGGQRGNRGGNRGGNRNFRSNRGRNNRR